VAFTPLNAVEMETTWSYTFILPNDFMVNWGVILPQLARPATPNFYQAAS